MISFLNIFLIILEAYNSVVTSRLLFYLKVNNLQLPIQSFFFNNPDSLWNKQIGITFLTKKCAFFKETMTFRVFWIIHILSWKGYAICKLYNTITHLSWVKRITCLKQVYFPLYRFITNCISFLWYKVHHFKNYNGCCFLWKIQIFSLKSGIFFLCKLDY